ncbi:MAG: HAD family hydrolase [Planctomycetota bacterium]
MSFEAVIFDMDGVLVDSEPMHFRTTNLVLGRRGQAIDAAFYEPCTGMAELAFFELLVSRLSLTESAEALARERVAESLRVLTEDVLLPMDGALECLLSLRLEGRRLALASSATRSQVALVVERLGLNSTLPVTVSADDVLRAKPAPDLFLLAAKRLGTAPERCLVVEDAVLGVKAARAAGMQAVALVTGVRDGRPHREAGALDCLRSLRELDAARLERLEQLSAG